MRDRLAQLRYVVLRHEGVAEPHFDLMFETSPGSVLRTWRAPRWPLKAGDLLTGLGEHRRAYLVFEGPVSGGRGFVQRVCAGTIELTRSDPHAIDALLDGVTELTLVSEQHDTWRCVKTSIHG